MKILLNKKATAALALCLSVSMATQGANTPPVSPSQAKDLGSNNIVVFLTIQYYCLSLRHE